MNTKQCPVKLPSLHADPVAENTFPLSRWQHPTSTISTIVINNFMNIRGMVFEKPSSNDPTHGSISSSA